MITPDDLLDRIRRMTDHPATVRELVDRLDWPPQQRATLRRRLAVLVERGDLIRIRGHRYGLPDRMHLVTGRVQVHPRGFGFVTPEPAGGGAGAGAGRAGDVYIAGTNLNQAMHGDRVVVRVDHQGEPGRAEGRIVRILERAASRLVGRYDADEAGRGYVVPVDRRLPMDVDIPSPDRGGARAGEMVVVELTRFPTAARSAVGRVVERLGDVGTPGVDVAITLRKFGIPDVHDPEAEAEARALGEAVRPRDRRGRTDFRRLPTVTIDGETARDFDDALTLEPLPRGRVRLGVHIADVAHYVAEGSVLDQAARERGTSVYFPDRAVHMFPDALATGLCSLRPGVDRLVQSCLMEIDGEGEVVRAEMHDGVIHSDARMTYDEVDAILADPGAAARRTHAGVVPLVEAVARLAAVLTGRRRRRGAIDVDLPVARFRHDEAGRVEAIVADERTTAHRIIEECMLIANETVAAYLTDRGAPALFRVHEPPDPLKVEAFETFASSLGYSLAAPSDGAAPRHFQRLLDRLRGTPEERPVALLMLRTMQQARYDPASLGHFGLATPTYTHFTSPIRRYPDVVVHRALRAARRTAGSAARGAGRDGARDQVRQGSARPAAAAAAPARGGAPPARRAGRGGDLAALAAHTSARERRAEEAERELVQWRKVQFMADKVGDEFTGYVIGVTAFGLFVELVEQFVEGLVHISSMADDYYRFVEDRHLLRGEHAGRVYRLGDRVRVQLVRVDREHRQIDLALTEILDAVRRTGDGRTPRPPRAARPGRRPRGRRAPRRR